MLNDITQSGNPEHSDNLSAGAATQMGNPGQTMNSAELEKGVAAAKLPQTGQLWWPVLLLAVLGVLMLLLGIVIGKQYNDKHEK